MTDKKYTLGIDIGSTTVKIAILDEENQLLFADYERHFANIQETLAHLLGEAHEKLGELTLQPVITGSGGLALANHLGIPFTQEVIAVSTSLKALAPQTDVAIELGGEDAKIIYFEGGNVEQRMNGICAGGTGSFIDQMASLLQTDATGLNEYAKHYQAIYPIAARCGVFAKTDIQPLINDGATKEDLSASIFQAVGELRKAVDRLPEYDCLRNYGNDCDTRCQYSGFLRAFQKAFVWKKIFYSILPDPDVLHRRSDPNLPGSTEISSAGHLLGYGCSVLRCNVLHHRRTNVLQQQYPGGSLGGGAAGWMWIPWILLQDCSPAFQSRYRCYCPVGSSRTVELLL